jgi:hypothetical protein
MTFRSLFATPNIILLSNGWRLKHLHEEFLSPRTISTVIEESSYEDTRNAMDAHVIYLPANERIESPFFAGTSMVGWARNLPAVSSTNLHQICGMHCLALAALILFFMRVSLLPKYCLQTSIGNDSFHSRLNRQTRHMIITYCGALGYFLSKRTH